MKGPPNILTLSLTLTLFIIAFSATILLAQHESHFTFYGSLSLPTDGYGKNLGVNPHLTRRDGFDVGNNASFAASGVGAGIEFSLSVGIPGLSWVSSLAGVVNGSDDAQLTQRFRNLLGDTVDVEFDYGRWIHMPVMTGFQYSVPVTKSIGFYGMVQGGLSLIQPATRQAAVGGVTVDERKYDLARQFGFGLGGGIVIAQRFDLGVRYLDFGEPSFDGTRFLDEDFFSGAFDIIGEDVILGERRPVSMLMVILGYRL